MDCTCTIYVAKNSFTVIAKLILAFVFAYAKSRFSHDGDQLTILQLLQVND